MPNFAAFRSSFKGDLITPDHPEYESSLSRWAANASRRAAIVAFVTDETDVALALRYARGAGLGIAVRGGGHNPAGASSITGGLVIDLSRHLSGTRVDPEARLAYVGGGALWAGVNSETAKYGLATTGGNVSHTGVGGLTLGGGFGHLTGSHGMAIDNLARVRIVTADGTALTASAEENSDLFWGLRGGGSNFGVVTEFVFHVHPQRPTVLGGFILYPASALEDVMKVIVDKHERGMVEQESYLMALLCLKDVERTPAIRLLLFWNGSEQEGREYYKAFYDIEPRIADETREMPYAEVNTLLDEANAVGKNYYMKSVDQPAPTLAIAKAVADETYKLSREHDLSVTYIFEHWNLTKSLRVPAHETAFRRSPRLSSLVNVSYPYDTPEQLALVRSIAERLTGLITAAEGDANVNNGYANYNSDAPSLVNPNVDGTMAVAKARALFGPHWSRLAELKEKYDPDLVFNKWYAIPPAALAKAEAEGK